MRILVVTPHYWPEPFRVADVTAGLKARGHEVHVVTALPDYPTGRFFAGYGWRGPYREEHEGRPVLRVPVIPRGKGGALRLVLNYLSFAVAAAIAAVRLGRRGWDVVFVFQLSPVTAILPALVVRWLHGTPVAIWVQDLWPQSVASTGFGRSRLLYAVARIVSGWLYRRCDRVLATSRAFQRPLEELGVPAARFEYVPQWVEASFGADAKDAKVPSGPWSEGFPVVFTGNIGRVQSLETLLGAADLLRADDDVRWVFVGDGSRREWLRDEVNRRGLGEKVFLLGRHPAHEMPAFYAMAGALLVSLSRDDAMALTLPAKVQSYLAAGKPIVGSIDGEGAKVIAESGAGLAAPAGDPDRLAEIVRRLKGLPPPEREAMGSAGRAYSDAHFAPERCLRALEENLARTALARAGATSRASAR